MPALIQQAAHSPDPTDQLELQQIIKVDMKHQGIHKSVLLHINRVLSTDSEHNFKKKQKINTPVNIVLSSKTLLSPGASARVLWHGL